MVELTGILGVNEEDTAVSDWLKAEEIHTAESRIKAVQPTATAVIVVFFKYDHLEDSIWKKWKVYT